MTNRNETFGRLLKGAINSIATYEGKTAPAIEDELGGQLGLAGSAIQRYKAGYLPPEPHTVALLAEAGIRRGFLARAWLTRFLQAARYPSPDTLIASLADALGAVGSAPADGLPAGTVALLFTDIAGSTQRWEDQPRQMERALERHDALIRQAVDAYGGHVFKTTGDGCHAAFTTALAALEGALSAQRRLQAEPWGALGALLVRMAIHVGTPQLRDGDYFGQAANRVARLLDAAHGGQVLLSLTAQELVRDSLPPRVKLRDLGEHRLKDLGRPERIFQAVAPELPADFPPLRTLDVYRHNLPSQPTPLIGREREAEEVCALLRRAGTRLVTLLGPGGIGKTRLALQVAAELLDDAPDGVTFVSLAPVREAEQVVGALAQALGLHEVRGIEPLAQVTAALAPRRALLVLDNCEQVAEAAPLVAALLAAAPTVRVLATSRAPLRLQGEQEYVVPPLALADTRSLPPLERLTQIEAVRLFLERAQAVRPDFQVTAENAPLIAEICARLDGLPLAIELAAARTKLFAPRALLARLDKRLTLLRGGARDLPARQQTLAGAIAWSYDLLDAAEQVLFARLGVFVDGCTLEAAEAVLGDDGDDPEALAGVIPTAEVLERLAILVDRSLVKRVDGAEGTPRFMLLETIREFALERLETSGEGELIRGRHAQWVRTLVEAADPNLRGPEQLIWYHRLDAEQSNIRAALRWCFGGGDAATGVGVAAAAWWYWFTRSDIREGYLWLRKAIASRAGDDRTRAAALTGSGAMVMFHPGVELTDGLAPLTEARGRWNALGEPWWEVYCLVTRAQLELFGNQDSEQAAALLEEAVLLTERLQSPWMNCYLECCRGVVAHVQGDPDASQAHYQSGLAAGRASGDRVGRIAPLEALARDSNAPVEQRIAWAEEALALAREMAFPLMVQRTLGILAKLYHQAEQHDAAARAQDESASIAREQGTISADL
jgi:predicted ATPase/class 3 adenylate cyclase